MNNRVKIATAVIAIIAALISVISLIGFRQLLNSDKDDSKAQGRYMMLVSFVVVALIALAGITAFILLNK